MTNADNTPAGDEPEKTAPGTALTPAPDRGIGPFIAAAEESGAAKAPRPLGKRLLDYSAHVAIVAGLLGLAWTIGNHLGTQPTAAQIEAPIAKVADVGPVAAPAAPAATSKAAKAEVEAPKAATPQSEAKAETAKPDEIEELRRSNARLSADVKALRANVEAMRNAPRQDPTNDVRALQADLKSVKSGLNEARTEADTALSELSDKVEKLQRQRTGALDTRSTGSVAPVREESEAAKAIPTPPAKPVAVRGDDDAGKPQVLTGWVVRDVYDGVALIEGRRGPLEVVPGVNIPGAGVVKSIDRHGNGWTVTTSKGQIAYSAPSRDFRRADAHRFYEDYSRY